MSNCLETYGSREAPIGTSEFPLMGVLLQAKTEPVITPMACRDGSMAACGTSADAIAYFPLLDASWEKHIGEESLAGIDAIATALETAGVAYDYLDYIMTLTGTPAGELADPLTAITTAKVIATAHGVPLLVAVNWTMVADPNFDLWLAVPDMWTLLCNSYQGMYLPGNEGEFRQAVRAKVRAMQAVNPSLIIWAQINQWLGGLSLTFDELMAYRRALTGIVSGTLVAEANDPARPAILAAMLAADCVAA